MTKINIVDSNGLPIFGLWKGKIREVNPQHYKNGITFSIIKPFREKKWQYIGLYGHSFQIGLAVVDTGYLGNVFCYLYDVKKNQLTEFERNTPLSLGITFDRNVAAGIASFRLLGEYLIINNNVAEGKRHITLNIKDKHKSFSLDVTVFDDMQTVQPLQTVTPTATNDFTFTHKASGLSIYGNASFNDQTFSFDENNDFAAIDYTFGFPAYHTIWNWASMAGKTTDGVIIGLNLVSPIHHDNFNENGIWINGKLIKTTAAVFDFDTSNTLKDWRITTKDGLVDLTFHPLGKREQMINLGIIKSSFQQPFGVFSGTINDVEGNNYSLKNVPGVVEDHDAHW